MRPDRATSADQADLRVGLSQASGANDNGVVSNDTDGIVEQACEPDLPLTYVACVGCGSMTGIHAATCPECDQPRPQQVAPVKPFDDLRRGLSVACIRCGDEDGPWAPTADGLVCEPCLERAA